MVLDYRISVSGYHGDKNHIRYIRLYIKLYFESTNSQRGQVMPIYEYECSRCGESFEAFRMINDNDGEVVCPVYGEQKPRRVVSRVFGTSGSGGDNPVFPT